MRRTTAKPCSTLWRQLESTGKFWSILGAAFIGVYPVAAASVSNLVNVKKILPLQSDPSAEMETLHIKGKTYYLISDKTQLRAIGTGEYGMDRNYMQPAAVSNGILESG